MTGAWHGASWNFILWGVYFGIILILEKLFILKILEKIPKLFSHLYSILLILIGWVIFAFEDLNLVKSYVVNLFNFNNLFNNESLYYLKNYGFILIVGIILSTPIFKKIKLKNSFILSSVYIIIFVLSTASLVTDTFNPFLYFRF